MNQTKFNWLAAALLALILGLSFHLDDNVDFTGDAQRQQMSERRKQMAAQEICGPGAYAKWLDDQTISCQMHTGLGAVATVSAK
jgi:hypothetical protein